MTYYYYVCLLIINARMFCLLVYFCFTIDMNNSINISVHIHIDINHINTIIVAFIRNGLSRSGANATANANKLNNTINSIININVNINISNIIKY